MGGNVVSGIERSLISIEIKFGAFSPSNLASSDNDFFLYLQQTIDKR